MDRYKKIKAIRMATGLACGFAVAIGATAVINNVVPIKSMPIISKVIFKAGSSILIAAVTLDAVEYGSNFIAGFLKEEEVFSPVEVKVENSS